MAGMKLLVVAALCLSFAAAHTSTPEGGSWSSQEDTSPEVTPDAPGPPPPDENEYDYGDDDDEYDDYDLDLDSEEDKSSEEINRVKRKVIFGGGGGYSGVGRRGGGGGDPYGRRRGGHNYHGPGPDYNQGGSWPYGGGGGDYVDTSGFDNEEEEEEEEEEEVVVTTPPITYTASPTPSPHTNSRAYGIVRTSPSDNGSRSTTTRGRQGRREAKEKLTKSMKQEIAQYALAHSTQDAVHHYADKVGRRLSRKKVEKFVQRYQQRVGRTSSKN